MPLRCLIFSSNEATIQPIWPVLTDLGIEGEYCQSAVDAVERVTTQLFQIVVTDWDDQPEAAFLLKTARDLKAAQRPLTLAIVGDEARPEALKAGANSVLLKPLRPEQVRDTMSTACQLLRAKQQAAALPAVVMAATPEAAPATTMAAAAAAGAVSVQSSAPFEAPSLPSSVTQSPEKAFRAGEFLQPPRSVPGAQFDVEEKKSEADQSLDEAAAEEVDALTELEPMASAVETPPPVAEPKPQEALTGWAALQARLMKTAPLPPAEEAPAKREMLAYGEAPSLGARAQARPEHARPEHARPEEDKNSFSQSELQPLKPEAVPSAHVAEDTADDSQLAEAAPSKLGRIFLIGLLAAGVALVAVPRTRRSLPGVFQNAVRSGKSWLNPPPAPLPQATPQHDSFGQSGDEYNLPVVANIPDATTDPSQIRVVPVIDPTAKPDKNAGANGEAAPAASAENAPGGQNPTEPPAGDAGQPQPQQTSPTQTAPVQTAPEQAEASAVKNPTTATIPDAPKNAGTAAAPPALVVASRPDVPEVRSVAPPPQPHPAALPVPKAAPSPSSSASIPSSMRSQMASMTPAAGGNKPAEAALSSIEPVILPESAARDLLTQPVDPVYPAAARASGQKGSVVLQVLIGRDGTVQDAKFLQGSLVFARAGIDAVKQWHFRPYSMNGRAVSVQSLITLNFKPPA
jgi:TonB family protein